MNAQLLRLGAIFGFLGVLFGAFGAHGLKPHLSSAMMSIYETGIQYHLLHAMAILIAAVAAGETDATGRCKRPRALLAGKYFAIGIVVFSGSLYALAISGTLLWGAVTPIGGLAFLTAWILLAMSATSPKSKETETRLGDS